ncbi:hypothetical protein PT974_00306 [Cladobotryum mycophilum]|uniref:Uncharacterized protein n=1 Tax=Cladobotryum mycophilum TaxID=491253 RepID=A0ABR0T123_9HYPO
MYFRIDSDRPIHLINQLRLFDFTRTAIVHYRPNSPTIFMVDYPSPVARAMPARARREESYNRTNEHAQVSAENALAAEQLIDEMRGVETSSRLNTPDQLQVPDQPEVHGLLDVHGLPEVPDQPEVQDQLQVPNQRKQSPTPCVHDATQVQRTITIRRSDLLAQYGELLDRIRNSPSDWSVKIPIQKAFNEHNVHVLPSEIRERLRMWASFTSMNTLRGWIDQVKGDMEEYTWTEQIQLLTEPMKKVVEGMYSIASNLRGAPNGALLTTLANQTVECFKGCIEQQRRMEEILLSENIMLEPRVKGEPRPDPSLFWQSIKTA